jgi:outer membrane protein OmpA-like peptidoglycan-associated protein
MKNIALSFSILILFTLSFFFNLNLIAQNNIEFSKSNFKNDATGFKTATKHLQEGNSNYYRLFYNKALDEFLAANNFNPNNADLNAKIGDCYLNSSDKSKAINFFKKAYSLNKELDGYYLFMMAKAYHINNQFDNAIKYYRLSSAKKSKIDSRILNEVDKKIEECSYAKDLIKTPINVEIVGLTDAINSEHEEYVPVITADESEIFFTSRRPNTIGGNTDLHIGDYYEDIYYSKKENGKWSIAENIGKPVNNESHDATVGLSLDGQKLFIYRDNKKGIGNIYVTEKDGDKWTEPVELPEPINSKNQETSACYSFDGNTIYFVSNRPNGQGGKDIYKATKSKEGIWGAAENLGPIVNSQEDEDAVFLHPDGKTLYFSSKGHYTMGGYDIFKTVNEKGRWSAPVNIGYPINTADDDVCFVLTASGDYGYYTSIKVEGQGKRDIYRVVFLDELNKPKLTLLKGVISDKKTGKLLQSTIEIYDNDEDKLVGTFESNSSTGKYMVSLPAGRNYGISVKKKGYLFYSENFNIPKDAAFQVVEKNVTLDKLEVGKKVVLKNIFYDYNEASLRVSSYNELNKVIELLKANPKMKVELSAHTDSRGSDAYNNKLSQARAQSCVNYLVGNGVYKSRLVAIGYGEKQLIISDEEIARLTSEVEKENEHQKNRRTEFKIIEN